jgi:hypothetical protein
MAEETSQDRATRNEVIAGLRELLEMQDAELKAKDREIAALKRAATIRAEVERNAG